MEATRREVVLSRCGLESFWDCLTIVGEKTNERTSEERDSAEKKLQVSECGNSRSESIVKDSVNGIVCAVLCTLKVCR